MQINKRDVEVILRRLGVGATYRGFRITVSTVEYIFEMDCQNCIYLKDVYNEMAKRFDMSYGSIERNVRTVVDVVWRNPDHTLLDEIAMEHLTRKPNAGKFIDILVYYIVQKYDE